MLNRKYNKSHVVVKIVSLGIIYFIVANMLLQLLINFLGKYVFHIKNNFDIYPKVSEYLLNTEAGTLYLKIIESIGIFLTLTLLLRLFDNKSIKEIKFFQGSNRVKNMLIGLGLGALSITLIFLTLIWSGQIITENSLKYPRIDYNVFLGIIVFILVAINEEVLCRGYILNMLDIKHKPLRASIVSSCLFSIMHILNPNVKVMGLVNIFLIGMLFSYMYIKTNNLWMSIGHHTTWNYFQGNVFGFSVSGQNQFYPIYPIKYINKNIITGGKFGPEAGILATLIIGINFVIVWEYINCKKQNIYFARSININKDQ
ncbi:CPBP family intramembrane glutamic endopeptidase [Clostridium massiliodielmoense]|uniref:CPBP family intramembrane glutamic endopeptidase n=1 Tax=Clostridium massiliodielmoense TaxID=1776385 RepID=UPI001FA72671|nr:type II CAAX endopeptidase family protein [Clostridium massiliodielmoense]